MNSHKNKELEELKEHYHSKYLKIGWDNFTGLGSLTIIIQVVMILFVQSDTVDKSAAVFPILGLIIEKIIDSIVTRNK